MTNFSRVPRTAASAFGGRSTGRTCRAERLVIFAVRIRIRRLRWLRLYGEPGVWNDPAKRDAMLRARLACHEAEAQWGRAVRDCGAAHRTARNHRNRDNRGR